MVESDNMNFTPVIIVGAGRSGTNAFRDLLSEQKGFVTWPCDEIDAIWMHGNIGKATDVLTKEDLNDKAIVCIRSAFKKIWQGTNANFVVEKTCANSLRVDFIAEVLPEAKFIHIKRDVMDVVVSSRKRWKGEFELPYLSYYLRKARFVPISDIPTYLMRYLKIRLSLIFGNEKHVRRWGPWTNKLQTLIQENAPIEEICAVQWLECVGAIEREFKLLSESRRLTITYEDLVTQSQRTMNEVLEFLGARVDESDLQSSLKALSTGSVGKGRLQLKAEAIDLSHIIKPEV